MRLFLTNLLVSFLNPLLKIVHFLIGKGSGAHSINTEVNHALRLVGKNLFLAIDIGGNCGEYSSELIKRCPNTEVHIFEPSYRSFSTLTNRFSHASNIFINQLAVSNETGKAELYTNEYGSGLTSLSKRRLDHFNINFEKSENVNLIRFEDYWSQILKKRPIDLVKIDVEGHELAVLEGMGSAIKNITVIQFEFGGCNIDSKTYFQDFWYFFKNKEFTLYRLSPIGLIKINNYVELDETFLTTNYLALNNLKRKLH